MLAQASLAARLGHPDLEAPLERSEHFIFTRGSNHAKTVHCSVVAQNSHEEPAGIRRQALMTAGHSGSQV